MHTLAREVLADTLASLRVALRHAVDHGRLGHCDLALVDNADQAGALAELCDRCLPERGNLTVKVHSGHGNIGYGAGHNLAIEEARSDCHLVLNPDVVMDEDALSEGLGFLADNGDVIGLSPAAVDGDGRVQHLCKRYPSLFDLLLRGFAPAGLRRRFDRRLAEYEMRELPEDEPARHIPIISGCFMLLRTEALQELGGFDPGYFLYFEDFDLSLRAQPLGALARLPGMRIRHLGGHSARKGPRHIYLFTRSALRFFNTHGWQLL